MSAREAVDVRRVAVVTGGASGIGLACGRHLAEAGHQVALWDRDGDLAAKEATELQHRGLDVAGRSVDVADRDSIAAAVDDVHSAFGPVTIAVTSAGVDGFVPFLELTRDELERVVRINLTGTFNSLQPLVPDMVDAGWGRIVTISSSSAQSGAALMTHYSASKGGVIALTKALAVELGPLGITANTIPPRAIDTPMLRNSPVMSGQADDVLAQMGSRFPVGRTGTPDDIAAACAFLCSDGAGYITGQVIGVNGGGYI
jgi:2-hydroxycyclohexanecarboxyl-CoA dehydrogenase